MPGSMLWPLLSMFLGFMCSYGAVLCMRLRGEVLNRERQAAWVREAINRDSGGFWAMGGYARFVWPCFGFAAVPCSPGTCGRRAAIMQRPACARQRALAMSGVNER